MAEGSYKGMDREYRVRTRIYYEDKWHPIGAVLVMPAHDANRFLMANAIEPVEAAPSLDPSPPNGDDDVH